MQFFPSSRFFLCFFVFGLLFQVVILALEPKIPKIRPLEWAQPVIHTELENWHQVDHRLYRSAQPSSEDMQSLSQFGIQSVLNLRSLHTDNDESEGTALKLYHIPIKAQSMTYEQLVMALKIIKEAKPPVLVHCWHGADRTGAVVAAYRIAFQNWSKKAAIEELQSGGYGFHKMFSNLIQLIHSLDPKKLRRDIGI